MSISEVCSDIWQACKEIAPESRLARTAIAAVTLPVLAQAGSYLVAQEALALAPALYSAAVAGLAWGTGEMTSVCSGALTKRGVKKEINALLQQVPIANRTILQAHFGHPAIQADITALNLLKSQLELRQKSQAQLTKAETIRDCRSLKNDLANFKAQQEYTIEQIAIKNQQINNKRAILLATAPDAKEHWYSSETIHQKLNRETEVIKAEIVALKHDLTQQKFITDLTDHLRFLRKQTRTPDINQQIRDFEAIDQIKTNIGTVGAANQNRAQLIAGFEDRMQKLPSLQPGNIARWVQRAEAQLMQLPHIAPAPLEQFLIDSAQVRNALNGVVDQHGLQLQQAAYDALAVLFVDPVQAPALHAPAPSTWQSSPIVKGIGVVATVGLTALCPSLAIPAVAVVAGDHLFGQQWGKKLVQRFMTQGATPAPALGAAVVVPAAGYAAKTRVIQSAPLPLDSFISDPINFPKAERFDDVSASLQTVANVKPLMNRLATPFTFVEDDLFTSKGVAQILAENNELDDAKKAALTALQNNLQANLPLGEAELRGWLRALTQGGLEDIHGLANKEKNQIFRLLMILELKEIYRNAKDGVNEESLDKIFNLAKEWKKVLDGEFPDDENWRIGDLSEDPKQAETFTRIVLHAIDFREGLVERLFGENPKRSEDSPVLLVVGNYNAGSATPYIPMQDKDKKPVKHRAVAVMLGSAERTKALVLKNPGFFSRNKYAACHSSGHEPVQWKDKSINPYQREGDFNPVLSILVRD